MLPNVMSPSSTKHHGNSSDSYITVGNTHKSAKMSYGKLNWDK